MSSLWPGEISLNYCNLSNSSHHNYTGLTEQQEQSFTLVVVISSVCLFICLLGLVGNGIVLWFLTFCLERTPFTVYVLNLAITDFSFLLFMTTFLILIILCFYTHFMGMFDVVEKILWVMSLINNTDLYFLTALSIQRCLSVMFPIWYRCQRPRHLSTIVSALLWLLSLLVIGLEVYFCTYEEGCIKITTFNFTINILIFTPLMVLSSLTLFIKIWCTSLQCQPCKLYVIIWLNILFFLIFALPLRIIVMLQFLRCMLIPQLVISLVILLASVNSSMNPILYFLVGNHGKKHILQPLKEVFQRIFQEETDPGEERDTPTMDTEQTLTQTQTQE